MEHLKGEIFIIETVKCKLCGQTLAKKVKHMKCEIKCPRCGLVNRIEHNSKGKSRKVAPCSSGMCLLCIEIEGRWEYV